MLVLVEQISKTKPRHFCTALRCVKSYCTDYYILLFTERLHIQRELQYCTLVYEERIAVLTASVLF